MKQIAFFQTDLRVGGVAVLDPLMKVYTQMGNTGMLFIARWCARRGRNWGRAPAPG